MNCCSKESSFYVCVIISIQTRMLDCESNIICMRTAVYMRMVIYVRELLFVEAHVNCRSRRSKHENYYSMHKSCQLQEYSSLHENYYLQELSLVVRGIIPWASIIILYARVTNHRRIVLYLEIAGCGIHRYLWKPLFQA